MHLIISHTNEAHPLTSSSWLLRPSLCWQHRWPERWQWEMSALFWIPHTWHVTDRSWWLAWWFSQVNIREVYSSPPSTIPTTSSVQTSASLIIRPDNPATSVINLGGSHACSGLTAIATVILHQPAGRECHSPLHGSPVIWPGMEGIGAKCSLHLLSKLLEQQLCAVDQKKQIRWMGGHKHNMLILAVKD